MLFAGNLCKYVYKYISSENKNIQLHIHLFRFLFSVGTSCFLQFIFEQTSIGAQGVKHLLTHHHRDTADTAPMFVCGKPVRDIVILMPTVQKVVG